MADIPQFPVAPSPFSGTSRKVDAGAGFEWLRQGWAVFSGNPGIWLGVAVIMIVLFVLLSFIPFLGTLGANLLLPVLIAGMLHMCRKQAAGETVAIGDLFIGFQRSAGDLVIIGALYMVAIFAIGLIATVVAGGGVAGGTSVGSVAGLGIALGAAMLAGLLVIVMMVPVIMAVWFAPALVFFNGMQPVDAMKASFSACAANWVTFLIYIIILMILGFLALIPFGLGYLVLIPVLGGALYASYRDVFPGT